ncbi:SUMF1/EgtB/PvdO family nonheme iron enzyme [Ideonella sp. 4Y11]|uniref:SUMF1/EgtB/PvdO family nonheme iron enzyme n=1 Tax=Ideonella aquatica TaxID=2824119 RepID=A0A941BJM3_9BURK|nr:SUMF1/EgtB/PvdO family nonheme iron enzyme [Ideonella aquatica]MBQ0959023.1 SUMF1/EgtB/PvdO family nonheme iron enzyme [Ideonella aquatica]
MASASPSSNAASASAEPIGPTEDWLGYGPYADSLWARMQLALSQPWAPGHTPITSRPGADPLVVGVYGEWGVGKSKLLELVYDRAVAENAQRLQQRSQDPEAWARSPALHLVVPVWFHPWRYENEPSLAVPLLMHVTEALHATLKQAASTSESMRRDIAALAKAGNEQAKLATRLFTGAKKVMQVAGKVAGNEMVKATAGAAASLVNARQLAEGALEWVEETAERFAGDDEVDGQPEKKAPADGADKDEGITPSASADGRYHYNVQKYLRELSHVTPALAKRHGQTLRTEVHLRFAVFIDDLDRCLPENAVAVLELIKTLLNVESFAFMVALDDEVIERGISHRYRDYRFKGAKPEMPITGFEYLEKIVHLPFRLPALTRSQAEDLLRHREERLLRGSNLPRLWFPEPLAPSERGRSSETKDLETPWVPGMRMPGAPSKLTELLLDSFDAYVPRKLLRTQELVHQWQRILAERGYPLGINTDALMLLSLALLQLFAPDVYRLVRRREGVWQEWMNAYRVIADGHAAVFSTSREDAAPHYRLHASNALLYRWAAKGPKAGLPTATSTRVTSSAADVPEWAGDLAAWRAALATTIGGDPVALYAAENHRLPLVLALGEYFDAQRHAFNPLQMGASLAALRGSTEGGHDQGLARYWQMLPDAADATTATQPSSSGDAQAGRRRDDLDLGRLLSFIASTDASARSGLVRELGLAPGDWLPSRVMPQVVAATASLPPSEGLALWALLAPHVVPSDLSGQDFSPHWEHLLLDPDAATTHDQLLPALDTLRQYGLLDVLNLTNRTSDFKGAMATQRDDAQQPAQVRERAAVAVARLGDDRFNFDGARWGLPTQRHGSQEDEPIVGFVRCAGLSFTRGEKDEDDNPPVEVRLPTFYMARTLTTVAQWAAFMQGGGYDDEAIWPDPQGWAWRLGRFDNAVDNEDYKRWLAERPAGAARSQPRDWYLQLAHPQHPVCGINWFEARAYACWLHRQLQAELTVAGMAQWQVRLPTEDQYERAARASTTTATHRHRWPWGDEVATAANHANVEITGLRQSTPVGLFAPNPLGLYDISGNLWEWQDNLYKVLRPDALAARVAAGQALATHRTLERCDLTALRGGSWGDVVHYARCAYRIRNLPGNSDRYVGLRVVLSLV